MTDQWPELWSIVPRLVEGPRRSSEREPGLTSKRAVGDSAAGAGW